MCLRCADLDLGDEGLECDTPGVLLTTLPLASGYWRASNETTTIRECLNEDACEGGSVIQRSDDYCAVGYQGPCECLLWWWWWWRRWWGWMSVVLCLLLYVNVVVIVVGVGCCVM